jgi:hypothetical protein
LTEREKKEKRRETKKKINPRLRCKEASVLVVLVLRLQHPVLVLVFE